MAIDEEGASETIKNRLRKLDRNIGEADKYWAELQKALSDPHYQPQPQALTRPRQPSLRKSQSPRVKGKRSAESEERRRRNDPLGFSRRSIRRGGNVESPVRKGPDSFSDEPDRSNSSLDGGSLTSPGTSSSGDGVIQRESASVVQATLREVSPSSEHQQRGANAETRPKLSSLDLESSLANSFASLPEQLEQVSVILNFVFRFV